MGPFAAQISLFPSLEFRLWPCCLGWVGAVVPFTKDMSGLRRTVQGARWKVCGSRCPSPCPLRDCCGAGTLPLQSRAGALGACDKPHWAWASWLLKASYHVGGLAPQDPFPVMRGQCQWSRYQSPLYLAPRANPDPPAVLLNPNRTLPALAGMSLVLQGILTAAPLPAMASPSSSYT